MADIELDPTTSSERGFFIRNGDGSDMDLTGATVTIEWNDPNSDSEGRDGVSIDDAGLGRCLYTFNPAMMRLRPGVTYLVRIVVNNNGPSRIGQQGGAPLTMRVSDFR